MQLINYDALIKNAEYFKSLIGNAKLCAVLKNDAYGHGLIHIARHLVDVVDCFAVGSTAEAEKIAHLQKDILLLLPQDSNGINRALSLDCILTVDSFSTLASVKSCADKLGKKARVHIKIDSGMSRLGFRYDELNKLIEELRNSTQIDVQGVYSHFWGEDSDSCNNQLAVFNTCRAILQKELGKRLTAHIANTSATVLSSDYHLDMVRVGLGLYGYGSDGLHPVKTVTAKVISANSVKAGAVVGYGGKYEVKEDTRIAVLNVGYAQGFARKLVGAKVEIGGRLFPVVAVCMAMIMVDVGNSDIKVGDVATLLGDNVNIENDDIIVYELLCNLH